MTTTDWTDTIAALAEPTRLHLLKLLTEGPASVNTLAERLRLSQYNASRHLTALRQAGLVEAEKQGTTRLQSISKSHSVSPEGVVDFGFCVLNLGQLPAKQKRKK